MQRERASPTVSLVGGSGVRRRGTVDDRVSSEVGKLRDGSQQAAGVCEAWGNRRLSVEKLKTNSPHCKTQLTIFVSYKAHVALLQFVNGSQSDFSSVHQII